ncbi:MAG: folylpolyglutamate synthase/dihydrofolate synthase family protein [Acidobacteriota bacterium]
MGAADPLLQRFESSGIRLGLEASQAVLTQLGSPHLSVPTVLVAGTNGKGSTSSWLAAMVAHSGYRVGLFTSPHLERPEERIRIDGAAIGEEKLAAVLQQIIDATEALRRQAAPGESAAPPTYFEALTLAAFLAFAQEPVDLAVLEVGLGGRLDSTNVSEPILSLITEIAFDHQKFLGDTLPAIAREKAGILRAGRPALSWISDDGAFAAVQAHAQEIGALHACARDQVAVEEASQPPGPSKPGPTLRLRTDGARYSIASPLPGAHQVHNLALALRGAETLATLGFPKIHREAISAGAAACRWPGRLEWVQLPNHRSVLLDGAHNPNGALQLANYLRQSEIRPWLLFGAFADKDVEEMLKQLAPAVRGASFTTPPGTTRGLPAAAALDLWRTTTDAPADWGRDAYEEALEHAIGALSPGQSLVVCGSLYLTGAARQWLHQRFGQPQPATAPLWAPPSK